MAHVPTPKYANNQVETMETRIKEPGESGEHSESSCSRSKLSAEFLAGESQGS